MNVLNSKFIKQYVQVITKTKITEEIETEAGISLIHAPMGEEGIFLDSDDHFVYLGIDKTVTTAISRNNISSIKIIEKENNVLKLADRGLN